MQIIDGINVRHFCLDGGKTAQEKVETVSNYVSDDKLDISSEAMQGRVSAVADKRLPNHWAKDFWLSVLVVELTLSTF